MRTGCRQMSMTEPEVLFEPQPDDRCKCLLLYEFLFEWKTSS